MYTMSVAAMHADQTKSGLPTICYCISLVKQTFYFAGKEEIFKNENISYSSPGLCPKLEGEELCVMDI